MSITTRKWHKGFWQLADPKIWVASTVPMVVAVSLAIATFRAFSFYWFLIAVIGVYLIEIGKNAVNECVDYLSGVDPAVDAEHRTNFSGGKKAIVDGLLTVGQSAIIAVVTMVVAALIGLYIAFFREIRVLFIGLAGFFLAVVYSLPPFKLSYRGLGEIAVGLTFGPLIFNGMFLVMAQRFDFLALLVSLPFGFLITNIIWINQFPDYEADRNGGKRNWVVRLGKKKACKVYGFLFLLNYLSIITIAGYTQKPIWLIGLTTIPLANRAVRNCSENFHHIKELIKSNAATVQIYLATGLLLAISALFTGFLVK